MIKVYTRPTIELRKLTLNYSQDMSDDMLTHTSEYIGKYPYIQLGNTVIQNNDMVSLKLYNNHFLPKVEIQFRDPTSRIIDPLFPLDDTILSLFIQSTSELLYPIRMDFKITETGVSKGNSGDNQELIFNIVGLLNINYLYFTPFSSNILSSYDLLNKISSEAKLGFASNVNDTNDTMTWINPGETNLEFIQDIVKYSYRSDESFMYAYIDFYYNLNYIDIETALNEDITDQTGVFSSVRLMNDGNKEETSKLFLTNHADKMGTNSYIDKYELSNTTTKVNFDIGYKSLLSYYDKNGNTYYKLYMDTISTPGKSDGVVLKGAVGEISELVKNSITNVNLGKLDTDNVHANFLYAFEQNYNNLQFLQKIKVLVTLPILNFNLYRFQKIEMRFYKLDEVNDDNSTTTVNEETAKKLAGKDTDSDRLNKRLSGEWLITAINFNFNKINGFTQEVTLVKRELGFNDEDFNKNNS